MGSWLPNQPVELCQFNKIHPKWFVILSIRNNTPLVDCFEGLHRYRFNHDALFLLRRVVYYMSVLCFTSIVGRPSRSGLDRILIHFLRTFSPSPGPPFSLFCRRFFWLSFLLRKLSINLNYFGLQFGPPFNRSLSSSLITGCSMIIFNLSQQCGRVDGPFESCLPRIEHVHSWKMVHYNSYLLWLFDDVW